jgi:hypothetical protein
MSVIDNEEDGLIKITYEPLWRRNREVIKADQPVDNIW